MQEEEMRMSIIKWDPRRTGLFSPFSDFERFSDFSDPFFRPERQVSGDEYWHPSADIWEDGEYVMVKLDLPGLEEKDIEVTFDGHLLSIKGERGEGDIRGDNGYYSRERFYGKFHRILHLPATTSSEGLKARYYQGVLEIKVPKKEQAKRKAIKVEVAE
jgi:HSP20 family protein